MQFDNFNSGLHKINNQSSYAHTVGWPKITKQEAAATARWNLKE